MISGMFLKSLKRADLKSIFKKALKHENTKT